MWNKPTNEQLSAIPRFGEQDGRISMSDVVIYLHFFVGACDWYIAEYDGHDIFYGFACLGDIEMAEWGTISFQELKDLEIPFDVLNGQRKTITTTHAEVDCERDWKPRRFAEIAKEKGYPV